MTVKREILHGSPKLAELLEEIAEEQDPNRGHCLLKNLATVFY
jgi:hypothetical protein